MSTTSKNKALLSVHAAGLLFGGTSLFSKAINLSALDMTAIRSVIAVFVLFIFLSMRSLSLKLASIKDGVLMLVTGVLLGLHWVTYFHAMQVSSVAIGMIALFTYPVITIYLEPLVKGARPKRADIYCGFIVLFGVYLMVPSFSLESNTTLGVLWGISSALLFSMRNVIQRHYLSEYNGEVSIFYQGSVIAVMFMFFVGEIPSFDSTYIWIQLLVLGAIFTALPHALFASSLRYLNAKTVSLLACLQPVYGTTFALLILKEQPAMMTLIGGAIVVCAAAWETYHT
jgi:drug/metabolite transporter (DMT)-like permease